MFKKSASTRIEGIWFGCFWSMIVMDGGLLLRAAQ